MIPKIIHQVWIGPKPIPEYCLSYMQTWKDNHPGYEFKFWNNNNLPELPSKVKEQFDRYGEKEKWAFQCDVLRLYLINKFGGVYVDVDYESYRNIDDLLVKKMFFVIRYPESHWIPNSVFGSEPNNPIFTYIIENMKKQAMHGPIFLGREIKRYLNLGLEKEIKCTAIVEKCKKRDDILCVPGEYFFNKKFANKYAYHDALQSWLPKNED